MSKILDAFNALLLRKIPDVRPGDTLRVHQKVKEGNKERIQIFEGVVIAKKHGNGISATITVRKVVDGVGVERVFPLHAPFIDKIEVMKRSKVRRSKLYFLRTAKGKQAKLKNEAFEAAIADVPAEALAQEGEAPVETVAPDTSSQSEQVGGPATIPPKADLGGEEAAQ